MITIVNGTNGVIRRNTIKYVTNILLVLLTATLGPIVGGCLPWPIASHIALAIIGLIFGYLICGKYWWWAILIAILIYVGEAPGWGQPKGYLMVGETARTMVGEWWQVTWMLTHPYVSLAVRGCFFGIPSFIYSMPLAMWINVHILPHGSNLFPGWRLSEVFQFSLAALPFAFWHPVANWRQ